MVVSVCRRSHREQYSCELSVQKLISLWNLFHLRYTMQLSVHECKSMLKQHYIFGMYSPKFPRLIINNYLLDALDAIRICFLCHISDLTKRHGIKWIFNWNSKVEEEKQKRKKMCFTWSTHCKQCRCGGGRGGTRPVHSRMESWVRLCTSEVARQLSSSPGQTPRVPHPICGDTAKVTLTLHGKEECIPPKCLSISSNS